MYLFLRLCQRPSPLNAWVGFPLHSANTTSRGEIFGAADIPLCSGLPVCSLSRSFLPQCIQPQGSQSFYVRAERASLPPHAPDMLTVRIQAIDGTGTCTPLDFQPCRLLTFRFLHTFHLLRPARHYPRVRIWRSSFERQRDFNPPEQCAAQRTL
jgi:hypothetical protein